MQVTGCPCPASSWARLGQGAPALHLCCSAFQYGWGERRRGGGAERGKQERGRQPQRRGSRVRGSSSYTGLYGCAVGSQAALEHLIGSFTLPDQLCGSIGVVLTGRAPWGERGYKKKVSEAVALQHSITATL
ncbi:hypothetical protein NDU88_005441 [Pleurodeles waltl]|uniref:Uncharacterized protein n=1 Tax=Pleurodeles waltl TaxID=8319 RepID=A0AAV7LXB7_PLEWA|nr:hypothetical protein NDU88_005441 [Pleurodeles waltl]